MRQFLLGLFVSTLLGAAILFFSPFFIGEIEPWISDSYYYTGALVLACFLRKHFYRHYAWAGYLHVYFFTCRFTGRGGLGYYGLQEPIVLCRSIVKVRNY